MFCNPAPIPVMHTGTATSGKFGMHNTRLPINPVSTTLSTSQFPPKLHLDAGHITGSQALNINLQSPGSMKSTQLGPGLAFGVSLTVYRLASPEIPLHLTLSPFLYGLTVFVNSDA